MATSNVKYLGELRVECEHIASKTKIITDAPVDNFGKGEAFSPTDTLATSLASCMITVMGIKVQSGQLTDITGTNAEVTKVMASDPRRVSEIHVKVTFPKNNFSDKEKKILENTALTCPVAKSLHPDIKQAISFVWQ
ncbi:MAG: OsmC family protein [Bacteroidia bacterium]